MLRSSQSCIVLFLNPLRYSYFWMFLACTGLQVQQPSHRDLQLTLPNWSSDHTRLSAAMFRDESKKRNKRWTQPVNLQPVPFSWGDGSVQPLPAPSSDLNPGRYTRLKCLKCIANEFPPRGLNCFLLLWCFLLHFVLMLLGCPKESLLIGSFILRNYLCNWGMIVHLGTLGSKRQI